MSILKRMASAALALTLALGTFGVTSNAAEATLENGDYTATIHFYNASSPEKLSMCDPVFAHEADVTLADATVKVTFYAANPIPTFQSEGESLTDTKLTFNGTEYSADSDITTKAVKTFDTAGALFGISAGDELPTQALTVELPRDAVNSFGSGLEASAGVSAMSGSVVEFIVVLTDLKAGPTQTTNDSMEITAEVAATQPTYNVTIPGSVAVGTLSSTEDTVKEYSVEVEAANLGAGTVEISAPAKGSLTSGDNSLAFTNSFGTQTVTENSTLNGNITIKAADVANAAAGNYTGTANFTIEYFAE